MGAQLDVPVPASLLGCRGSTMLSLTFVFVLTNEHDLTVLSPLECIDLQLFYYSFPF